MNEILRLEGSNRQISSNCERYIMLLGIFVVMQLSMDPSKLLRHFNCDLCRLEAWTIIGAAFIGV